MTNIIMHGCNGRMGQVITDIVAASEDAKIVAGVDLFGGQKNDYPVYTALADVKEEADVVIDFSNAKGVDALLDYCVAKKIPCVLCSTGLSPEQLAHVEAASKEVAILRSANMSVGINLLMKVLAEVAPILAQAGFDIEIVEKHHNQKLDSPSGTALALAESINDSLEGSKEFVYDRSQVRQKRDPKEIGISAVRGGTIVGTHEVIFAGRDEVITFEHMAYSREIFAKGAVMAATFLAGKGPGLYDMSQVING